MHAQALVAQSPTTKAMWNITIFVVKDSKLVPEMIGTIEAFAKVNLEKIKKWALVSGL